MKTRMEFEDLIRREEALDDAIDYLALAKQNLEESLPGEAQEIEYIASSLQYELFGLRTKINACADRIPSHDGDE